MRRSAPVQRGSLGGHRPQWVPCAAGVHAQVRLSGRVGAGWPVLGDAGAGGACRRPGARGAFTFGSGGIWRCAYAGESFPRYRGGAHRVGRSMGLLEHARRGPCADPDAGVNFLANGWLMYQVLSSRMWGAAAFTTNRAARSASAISCKMRWRSSMRNRRFCASSLYCARRRGSFWRVMSALVASAGRPRRAHPHLR